MSLITGIRDFKDFIDENGIEFVNSLAVYIGYRNYFYDNPIENTAKRTLKDWGYLFPYEVIGKNIYKNLKCGNIILNDRDYISIVETEKLSKGRSTQDYIAHARKEWVNSLIQLGLSEDEIKEIVKFKPEFEVKEDD